MESYLLNFGTSVVGLGVICAKFSKISNCHIIISDYLLNDDNHQANTILKKRKKYFLTNSLKTEKVLINIHDFLDLNEPAAITKLFEIDTLLFVALDFSHEFSSDFLNKFLHFFRHRTASHIFSPVVFLAYNIQAGPSQAELTDLTAYFEFVFEPHNDNLHHTSNVISAFAHSIDIVKDEVVVSTEDFTFWVVDHRLLNRVKGDSFVNEYLTGLILTDDGEIFDSYVKLKFMLEAIAHIIALFSFKVHEPFIKDFLCDDVLDESFVTDIFKELCLIYDLKYENFESEIRIFEDRIRCADLNIYHILEIFHDRDLIFPYMGRLTKLIKLDTLDKHPYESVSNLQTFARTFFPRHWDGD